MEIRSIRDIPYEFLPTTSFHPAFLEGARPRILNEFRKMLPLISVSMKQTLESILSNVLDSPKLRHVWAATLEYRGMPLFTIRNLLHTNTTLPYRRVLVVNLDVYLYPAAYLLASSAWDTYINANYGADNQVTCPPSVPV
jgi:hypothetical protein